MGGGGRVKNLQVPQSLLSKQTYFYKHIKLGVGCLQTNEHIFVAYKQLEPDFGQKQIKLILDWLQMNQIVLWLLTNIQNYALIECIWISVSWFAILITMNWLIQNCVGQNRNAV